MGPDPFVTSPFKGPTLEGDTYDYHVITTDHPYMQEIGLSAFTTGELASWIFKKDKKNDFSNLKIFGFEIEEADSGRLPEYAEKILGLKSLVGDSFTFSAWRFDANNFEPYKNTLQSSSNWKYEQGKEKYTFKDLNFKDFFNKKTKIPDFSAPVTNIQLEYQNNIDDKVSNAIEMNNFVRYLRMSLPKSEWTKTQKARSEFILDIKSSFSKYIEWSGVVPFTLNLGVPTILDGQETDKCIKQEVVKFKLFLFDESLTKNNSRRVTLNELVLVRPQVDAFGRVGTKSNGEISALSTQPNPKQNKAGSLNIKWNEFEGKWESGTEQVIGMMVTPLEAAVIPTLDELMNQPIPDLITSPTIPVGSAMPLVMPNGNPFQIAPEYNSREGCRDKEDNNKFMVRVYNRLPVPFNSGDIVILNKIDGAWQPSIFEKASGPVDDVVVGVDGKWDFTYLMAHCDSYFCNTDLEGITFKSFEEGIRAYYYGPLSEDPLNGAVNYNDAIKLAQVDNNYFQITSFDCMGPNIGGLRVDGNALACTQYYKNPKGEEFGTYVRGNQSGPFFGCVFPDGYELGDKWTNYMSPSHDLLKPTGNSSLMLADPLQYIRQIQPTLKVFENNNQNLSAGAAGGMFVLQDPSVDHLPADIALNASPSGENGSPIKPIYSFQFLSSLDSAPSSRLRLDSTFFNNGDSKGIWMTYGEDQFNSAFDFTPVNPGRLTFRPLKLETYASFEFLEYNPSPNRNGIYPYSVDWWSSPNLGNTSPLDGRKRRGIFGCKNWIIMKDKESPISLVAWERNKLNSEYLVENPKYKSRYVNPDHPLAQNAKYNDIYGFRGLRYNIDIARNIPSLQSKLPPNKDANSFPATMWGWWYGWTHGPSVSPSKDHVIRYAENGGYSQLDWIKAKSGDDINQEWIDTVNERPAGVVGVIAARCTVTAKNRINIDTDAFFGVDSYRMGTPQVGYTYYASLLGAGDYKTFNTTNLHARVFHAWPKNLTIYDPRFFAVFHFNPGVGILDDENENPKYDWYNAGQLWEEELPGPIDINYPDGWYQVERSESEVDFRIPTSSIVNNDGISESLSIEAVINSDTARAKEHCNLDRKRRGRLLPYKYRKLDIGIAPYSDTFTLRAYLGEGNEAFANEVDFIILSPGKNYSVNDRFFVKGGDGDGVGTVLKPILANVVLRDQTLQNAIIGFETLSPGYGFSASNFLASDLFIKCTLQDGSITAEIKDDNGDPILPSLEIIPSGKPAGSDFKGHISRGRVIELIDVDNKPEEIGLENLTGNIDMPSSKDTIFTPPLIQTSKSIEITKPNTNNAFGLKNKYDVFFHFHNDISHTYSMTSAELINQPPQGYEQYATIDITPN